MFAYVIKVFHCFIFVCVFDGNLLPNDTENPNHIFAIVPLLHHIYIQSKVYTEWMSGMFY